MSWPPLQRCHNVITVLFTLDYEIHGTGEGDPYELMVEPTSRMLDQFDRSGAKLTILADVAEILKFREYFQETGEDRFHYHKIVDQLKETVRRGHDVQLHLHASYFNSRFDGQKWEQAWAEYSFANLPLEKLRDYVSRGKSFLEDLLKPVRADYRCDVFRAANWSMHPSQDAIRALVENGFRVDSSVFKFGSREGIARFDYSDAWSNVLPWKADPADIAKKSNEGALWEVPIYCERRWLGSFISPLRFRRAWLTEKHSVARVSQDSPIKKRGLGAKLSKAMSLPFRLHAWKADMNQCSGRQLIGALERAEESTRGVNFDVPFVIIGHSKLYNHSNETALAPFLEFVAQRKERFKFGIFSDLGYLFRETRE